MPLNLNDRCRLRAHPTAPLLTVARVFLDGDPEVLWAGCRWTQPGCKEPVKSEVFFPQSELEACP